MGCSSTAGSGALGALERAVLLHRILFCTEGIARSEILSLDRNK